jgi:hypothetical protein
MGDGREECGARGYRKKKILLSDGNAGLARKEIKLSVTYR